MDRSVGECSGRVTVGVAWGVAAGEETVEWGIHCENYFLGVAIDSSAKSVRLRNAVGKVECCGDGTI